MSTTAVTELNGRPVASKPIFANTWPAPRSSIARASVNLGDRLDGELLMHVVDCKNLLIDGDNNHAKQLRVHFANTGM
jgi:hypothetical protein